VIVYIESNFLLEISLDQEQAPPASAILALAEDGLLELTIPSFALSEPFSTIAHRHGPRMKRIGDLQEEVGQLQRSASRREEMVALSELLSRLDTIRAEQMKSLESVVATVLDHSRIIPLTRDTFQQAFVIERDFGLSPQDSVILASVFADLAQHPPAEPKCFVSANKRDFGDPGIRRVLRAAGCRYIGSFRDALDFLLATVGGHDADDRDNDDK
jgi:predicted nucleic acid-binding protein